MIGVAYEDDLTKVSPTKAEAATESVAGADAPEDGEAEWRVAAGEMPDDEILYDLADLFKVFSDTTRIKILFALMDKDLSVGDIAEVVETSQSAVSHQLRILKQARLVRFKRQGKQLIYSLADDHVHTMLSQGMTHVCE